MDPVGTFTPGIGIVHTYFLLPSPSALTNTRQEKMMAALERARDHISTLDQDKGALEREILILNKIAEENQVNPRPCDWRGLTRRCTPRTDPKH
jgi:hypothetical protein